MIRYYLTKLTIEGFRGINNEGQPLELKFEPGKVNSIYALNGLGKSSIYDALSYTILGTIPKLDQLEQTEDACAYVNNLFHSKKTATIQVTLKPDDGSPEIVIDLERAKDGTRTVSCPDHADPESLLASPRSDFVLLDKEIFARFIRDRALELCRSA